MKWKVVCVEEKAWKDENLDMYFTSLAVKLKRPVLDNQKLLLTGKVLFLFAVGILIGFVIGVAL